MIEQRFRGPRQRRARPRAVSSAGLGAALAALLVVGCGATASPAPEVGGSAAPTGLIEAAGRGDATVVRELLEGGAPVDARDARGATALVRAAYGNHLEAAGLLVAAGADVNLADHTQQSAYLIATSEVGDDPRLLELTLNAEADLDAKDSFNGTGLIRAAERAHVRIVERLLRAGIDRDHINRLGFTALHEAVVFGEGGPADQATVAALVAGGADLRIPDGRGTTALAHAEQRGQREVAAILRAAGATR
jgi:ankyrin repeat protein